MLMCACLTYATSSNADTYVSLVIHVRFTLVTFSPYSMLNAFQENRAERRKRFKRGDAGLLQAEDKEYKHWKGFWENEKTGLLLYACLHGTMEMVEYFVNKLVSTSMDHIM